MFQNDGDQRSVLLLRGIEIALETDRKVFTLSSETSPLESADSLHVTAWPRWVFRLPDGTSIEQQMVLPRGGNAVAFSWRLLADSPARVTLAVTPVFSAEGLSPVNGFHRESDSAGGRLTWQPNDQSTGIVADTNGQTRPATPDPTQPGIARPGSFEFTLGRRPAVLIFSLNHRADGCSDPLLGGFLARLAEERLAAGLATAERIGTALVAA